MDACGVQEASKIEESDGRNSPILEHKVEKSADPNRDYRKYDIYIISGIS